MHGAARNATKLYIIAAVWFTVMLATAMALLGPMGAVYAAADASPALRALGTMSLAIMTATAVAGLTWSRLGATLRSTQMTHGSAAGPSDDDAEPVLVTTT